MATGITAARYIEQLEAHQSDVELEKIQRYFKTGEGEYGAGDRFIGVRMGRVFDLAKEFVQMEPAQIEALLESPIHEARAGALSIMAKQVRLKATTEERKRELYELYLRRMDRVNNWDLVDLAARDVIGAYLLDKPRDILYELASSSNMWERRTAIISTLAFIRAGQVDDTFQLAEVLVDDDEDLMHKAVGGALREAGKVEMDRLTHFLDAHASTMPRTSLRYSIEHLDSAQREHYLGLKRTHQ